jgi:hypothetical protein
MPNYKTSEGFAKSELEVSGLINFSSADYFFKSSAVV